MYYSAEQLVEIAKRAKRFTHIPDNYWINIIRRNQADQKADEFNDVANLMHGEKLIMTTTCTSTPGLPALLGGFKKYNKAGAAVVCANIWMYDAFNYGLHNGKMPCLRQVKNIWTTRDGDMNKIAEEQGEKTFGMWNTNFHAATYKYLDTLLRKWIGLWSFGCIVCNYRPEYNKIIELTKPQKGVSIVVIPEFSI